ncbi:ABC transporter ATP-binding protein [Entomospira nematocerorum]|uniref:ABC transporter ATP-binding protein n=1 Tax=Entomospira nematocerorum TaxID=2719987 RepID=A0A968KUB7_9SPIO|nr:ABC transporter ATP-binding protein [Entomospira nematocera]NIZ47104.1 ABC transporter ATP-binding protein [Entomospira nematocera]WDI34351.1 ABC transporter ATP-binding protein [Entomospira nematocera]
MSIIELKHVKKKYAHTEKYAVKDFNLTIHSGEFIVFVGPSGCGKSTTLRMIAGLEDISEGDFLIDGIRVNDMSSKDRDIAMVFQSYALYPHMSVRDNIGYGLKLRRFDKNDIKERVNAIAEVVGISEYLEKKPKALSGGQQQRVALGRAMIRTPKIYLMDEPLSNLDAKLRTSTRAEIARMHRAKGAVTIYVTHDQVEAMTMADRIVLMSMGEIQQIGSPRDLYENPKNMFVATFMGMPPMSTIQGSYKDGYFTCVGFTIKLSPFDRQILDGSGYNHSNIIIGIRANHIKMGTTYEHHFPETVITITVMNIEYLGDSKNIFFEPEPGVVFVATIEPHAEISIDDTIQLVIDPNNIHLFDAKTKDSIKYHTKKLGHS